ncbi:MAG TPA: YgiQ family radical SAM protein, partial [Tenuifilaceae bacterium]|nr:YgiQ family radical SAM protein [Tenuifilaceae bacterium]
ADWSNSTNREYFDEVVRYHVSGRLKVAPEHTEDQVLRYMRKPDFNLFVELKEKFDTINRKNGLKQQLIPYFISSHPGCTIEHMQKLSEKVSKLGLHLEQVQDFTPTPMTLASTIFYTGVDPYTGKQVFTERSKEGKLKQRDLFFLKSQTNKRVLSKKRKKKL